MSGASSTGSTPPGTAAAGDPSMEDILASIRKILSDDDGKPEDTHPAPVGTPPAPAADDVLRLDESMLVPSAPIAADVTPAPAAQPVTDLVAPAAAAAAASSVETLVRTLASEQAMRVTSQGPTIEDIVRQEIRPLLKTWLDDHLPPLVERLVRLEIERVMGRVRT